MKGFKSLLKRIFPFIVVIVLLIALSLRIYTNMVAIETENSWDRLSASAQSLAERIDIRFTDHMNLLNYVADAIAIRHDELDSDATLEYLESVQNSDGTFFERIDIILPDGRQIMSCGERYAFVGIETFEQMAVDGTHISPRLPDDHTDQQVIYCGTPVTYNGEIIALLMGMITCEDLAEEFTAEIYDGNAYVFLIDRADGSYLIDKWHETLGNVKDLGLRDSIDGKEKVDISKDLLEGNYGQVAFVTETTGKNAYQVTAPINDFNWSVAVMAEEKYAFSSVYQLREVLILAGLAELAILIFFVVWNITVVSRLLKNEEIARQVELEKTRNEVKTVFLSSMSHDIRTPLNGIIGMLDVIKKQQGIPEQTQTSLQKIEVSARYLETLANDVLDLNELDSGKIVLNDDVVDLKQFAERVSTLVQNSANKNGIEYSMNLDGIQNSTVHCSRVHIQRILMNVIGNAIKYNNVGGYVNLTIEEKEGKKGKNTYSFIISDNGIGMSKEFQKNMFKTFEQEDKGARTKHQGYGLGLPIVKRLVEKMDGKITVESETGKGTTFTISIPMVVEVVNGNANNQENKLADISNVKILLVEDNELNMEIANTLLEDLGANITQAENGKIAVDKFAESEVNGFDVILMDVMMPVMDGLEATQKIRQLNREDAKTIPIIAMTANTFAEDVKKCTDAGMDEHVGKPIDMNDLTSKINELVKR